MIDSFGYYLCAWYNLLSKAKKKQQNALVTIYGNLKNIPKLFYAQGIIWIWDDISLVNCIRYKMSIAYFSSNENEM